MQIVIDIQDKYKDNYKTVYNGSEKADEMLNAIKNGKPLPKGHGRLIDANKFIDNIRRTAEITEERVGYGCCTWSEQSIIEDINNEPTIIEADTEET